MAKKSHGNMLVKIGSWAFLASVIIAIIAGFFPLNTTWTAVLIVLGLVVGLLNITAKESGAFLLAAVSLVIVAAFGGNVLATVSVVLQRILNALIIFVIPATIVVSIRAIFALAGKE